MAAAADLPEELVAVVLGRLPVRSLATSRGVCKAWRDLIDERQLLLRFLLPHSVRGLFINYEDYNRCHFLSRPAPKPTSLPEYYGGPRRRIDGIFDFIERQDRHSRRCHEVADHCNGLILFLERDRAANVLHVCNPTTRWSTRLPPCPADGAQLYYNDWMWGRRAFLVFDPLVSPEYYKVVLAPAEPERKQIENDDECRLMEWPPSAWTAWHEFSSTTGRWEEKVFVREGGEAAGTAGNLLMYERDLLMMYESRWNVQPTCRYAAYWKGALYIHWRGEFVSRLSLVDYKYRVIKTPMQLAECKNHGVKSFLGRSEKGVYIAAIAEDGLAILRVWTLSESGDQTEWVPKHQTNLQINRKVWPEIKGFDKLKYWTSDHEPEYWVFDLDLNIGQNVCWNSDDDDNIVDNPDDQHEVRPYVKFLGFHPYKEVIFLCYDDTIAVAFHLNSLKVQYLGPVHLAGIDNHGIRESFVYTPCLIEDY